VSAQFPVLDCFVNHFIRKVMKNGIITWDCKYDAKVMLIAYDIFLGGDNPMQAECSH